MGRRPVRIVPALAKKPRREMLFSVTGYALLALAALVPVKSNHIDTRSTTFLPVSHRTKEAYTPSYADLSTTSNDVSEKLL